MKGGISTWNVGLYCYHISWVVSDISLLFYCTAIFIACPSAFPFVFVFLLFICFIALFSLVITCFPTPCWYILLLLLAFLYFRDILLYQFSDPWCVLFLVPLDSSFYILYVFNKSMVIFLWYNYSIRPRDLQHIFFYNDISN